MNDRTSDDMKGGGQRKDGKPFKDNNTREDGSYRVGRDRPPAERQFGVGDGRKRGRRPKGTKNIATIWAAKLGQKMRIDGKEQTAAEWLVDGILRRGITKSDRAAEIALGEAGRIEADRERNLGKSDADIIARWLEQQIAGVSNRGSDDLDDADPDAGADRPDPADRTSDGGHDADQ